MGIASFVIGLICLILSPFFSTFLILPSILALVLGIIDAVAKSKEKVSKGLSIAGIILSTIALVICILIIVFSFFVRKTISGINDFSDWIDSHRTIVTYDIMDTAFMDNVKITLVSVNTDFKGYYDDSEIDDDCKILQANFEFENTGTFTKYISDSDFECTTNNSICERFDYVHDAHLLETLSPDQKSSGSVYFEVPKNADIINIEFDIGSYVNDRIFFEIDMNE